MAMLPGAAAALLVPWLLLLSPATDDGAGTVSWAGTTLDGRPLESLSEQPLEVSAAEPLVLSLTLLNTGSESVRAADVTLTGRVMGMVFFDYATGIDAELDPGVAETRTVHLTLDDLDGQGVGLVPTTVALLDESGDVVAERALTVQVEGSLMSSYGIFGLAIAGSTVVLLLSLLLAVGRGLLPENRWRRALQFLPVGTGLGLTLTFTLSAASLLTPSGAWWATFVALFSAAAFAVGYVLPTPQVVHQHSRSVRAPA